MKFRSAIIGLISILCFIAFNSGWTQQRKHSQFHQDVSSDSIEADTMVQLLESNADGAIIKIEIPNFQFGTMEHEGEQFRTIGFPGCGYTTEEGKPQLPVSGTLLGIPVNAEISLQVLDSDYSILSNYKLYPVPKLVIRQDEFFNEYSDTEFYLDKQFYAVNSFYPRELVELGFTGFIRDSRLCQVQFHPVQYNPATQTVKLYNRLTVKVNFRYANMAPVINQGLPRLESQFYENILRQNILNYDSARSWKKIPNSAAPALNPALLVSSSPAYKIIVDSDGMYHVTYEQLREELVQNLEEIDPRTFKLFNKGKQMPIFVRGENDGSFDEGDEIIFHGLRNAGTETYYDPFSDENVYWLYWNGPPGLRMVKRSANFPAKEAQSYRKFRSLVHTEFDNTFQRLAEATEYEGAQFTPVGRGGGVYQRIGGVLTIPPLPNDSWYWDVISSPNIKQFEFQLPDVAETSLSATVRVMLRGQTTHKASPDHHTQVWLNDAVMIEDAKWDGQSEHFIEKQDVSQDFLRNGKNVISVLSPGDTEAKDVDQILFNWIEVEYWREFTAVDDYLEFSVPIREETPFQEPQNVRLTISNFSHPNVEIYGTDGSIYVDNLVQEDIQKPGTYQVRFLASQLPSSRQSSAIGSDYFDSSVQYIALTPDKLRSPKRIIKDEPSNLRSSTNGADYIIITHESLYPGVLPLAEWRQKSTQGLRIEVVKVQDIYDEFNFGIFNPHAIKDFLAYAYSNWQPPAPTYVVLAGDASYQYKTDVNFVPTNLVQTPQHGAAASDGPYVAISGNDSLPDMLISRLPARNLIELDAMVSKIIAYESSPEMGPWRKRLLFLSGVGFSFKAQSEALIKNYVPPNFEVSRIYADDPKSEYYGGSQEVIDNLNNGALIVNFLGHGGGSIWSDNRMLGLEDVPLLENSQKLPFVISMTCYTGYFDHPHGSSLSEEMMKSDNGGAIAFYGSTGLGWLWGDYLLVLEIFDSIFKSNINTIGEIITNAEIQFLAKSPTYIDLIEIFNLFGDSALALERPKLPVSLDVTPSVDEGDILNVRGTISDRAFNGKAEIILSDSKTKKTLDVTAVDVLNGRFETAIPLPSNSSSELDSESSIGVVQAYVWNEAIDGVGYKTYTIGGPNITNVRTEPEVIPPDEPIHILSEVRSSNRVKSVIFYYRTSPGKNWSQIEMKRLSGDTFKTVSALPGYFSGAFIYYYIEAIDVLGRKAKTPNQTVRIARYPDLFISEKDIRWTVGVPSLLSANVKNTGQLEVKDVVVKFFNGPPENGYQVGTDKIIPALKSNETATVQIEWQPEENQQTVFVVVDPKSSPDDESGKIIESNEFNNIASKEFFRDKFVLTPEQGSNGVVSSIDGNLFFQLPKGAIAEDAVLTIEKRDNVEISEQPDLRYAPIGKRKAEGGSRKEEEGISYQLNIIPMTSAYASAETDALHITKFDARLMIKFDNDSSTSDVSRLAIYLKDEETDKWLYVGGELLNDMIAASISEPGLYALMENNDHTPPQIEITVEHQGFIDGSYISETPIISARITDENGVDIRANRLMVFLDNTIVDTSEYTYSVSPTRSNLVLLSYAPTLSPGTHNISVLAFDASNLSAQESISGEVAGELEIKNAANYPNPFEPGPREKNKGTIFAYILTTQADKLTLKIYTATGKLVKAMDDLDAFADYNEYHWNGLDEDDEELANGVYFYKLIAEKENKRVNKIGKLAILR